MAQRQLDLPVSSQKPAAADAGGSGGRGKKRGKGGHGGDGDGGGPLPPTDASLANEAQRRYLNYAVSVITSRALPDVRDGLKPVQRRILYAMYNNLHLYPDARFRKCALIVGDVLGKFHPHGDTSCYDAMVRMAQDFSLRYLLVEGHGNFGSLDGDGAAAYRYTEARLAPLAMELLSEIKQGTVDFRPNYDGTTEEPIVDFPTGGQITNSKKELRDIYETGQGGVRLRGEWKTEAAQAQKGSDRIIVTSIPFGLAKSTVVERIAEIIIGKKLPMLVDVRDESTSDVRIVLELKGDADPALVMSYLYKHTPLEQSFHCNFTVLVPTENKEIAGPMRLDLRAILREFLDFREEVVIRRFQFELGELERRIHILEGFRIIFDLLDEAIRIIRKSDGKADAASKLMKRFGIDDVQTDAILELKLYKLARLEIQAILDELRDKQTRAKEIRTILGDKRKLWKVIRTELSELSDRFKDKRRTRIGGAGGDDVEFDAEAFILDEDATVVLSRDGWLKRSREIKDLSATRLREGDAVLSAVRGSTKDSLAIFSNLGSCYVMRINDVPASTGYGEPIQKLFNFRDGERAVSALVMTTAAVPAGTLCAAVTRRGFGMRFGLDAHRELSTRAGRRFARVADGDEVVGIGLLRAAGDVVCVVTTQARALICRADELPELANPGRGVTVIKVAEDDGVAGVGIGRAKEKDVLIVELDNGKKIPVGPGRYSVTGRAGRGHQLARKVTVTRVSPPEPPASPALLN